MVPLSVLVLLPTGCFSAGMGNDKLVHQLDREIIACRERVERLEASQNWDSDEPSPIYAELVQIFAGSEVAVDRQGPVTRVTFSAALLFAARSLRIRSEAGMYLDLMSTALDLHPDFAIEVRGHTDDTPTGGGYFPTNWELSAARAAAVARELIDEYEVEPARVTISGRGAFEPVADNDTPEGRAANRRVEVYIIPPGSPH